MLEQTVAVCQWNPLETLELGTQPEMAADPLQGDLRKMAGDEVGTTELD